VAVIIAAMPFGCSREVMSTSSPVTTASPIETPVSPLALSPVQIPLAQTTYTVPTPPTPPSGKGVIHGQLFVEKTRLPMVGVELYLGDHIGMQEDVPLYGLDPSTAQHTAVIEGGYFVFDDVLPGRYVLAVWNASSPRLARNPDTGTPLDVTVEPDQVVDVGVLVEPMQ